MTAELFLRAGQINDLPELLALEQCCFDHDRISRKSFRHLLLHGHADLLVGSIDGILIADAVLLYRKNSHLARIYSLAVHPARQGAGIGRALLKSCEQAAITRGCNRLSLEVAEGNHAALQLYNRSGFQPVSRIPDYYANGESCIRQVKSLFNAIVLQAVPFTHTTPSTT